MLSEQEEKEKLEAEAKAKTEAKAAEKAKWDEQQQKADQEAANARKAREQVAAVSSELETTKVENETLREQLAAAEVKAAEAGITDVELDEARYEGTDLPLVKAIKSLKEEIKAKDKRFDALEKKAADYEKRDREEQAMAARNSVYEELLTDLDAEYGADCRNEAVKAFNQLIADGKLPKGNPAKSTREMEKCYKAVKAAKAKAEADKTNKDKSLSLDSGSGGGEGPNLSGTTIKKGQSLDEAVEQVAAASKT